MLQDEAVASIGFGCLKMEHLLSENTTACRCGGDPRRTLHVRDTCFKCHPVHVSLCVWGLLAVCLEALPYEGPARLLLGDWFFLEVLTLLKLGDRFVDVFCSAVRLPYCSTRMLCIRRVFDRFAPGLNVFTCISFHVMLVL